MKPAGNRKPPPVIGIAGWKKSGKTTLTTRLVAEFTARGLKVATVKHAHHDFQIDERETDSARHRRAGAAQVAIVSAKRWAIINELGAAPEPTQGSIQFRADRPHGLEPAPVCVLHSSVSARSIAGSRPAFHRQSVVLWGRCFLLMGPGLRTAGTMLMALRWSSNRYPQPARCGY